MTVLSAKNLFVLYKQKTNIKYRDITMFIESLFFSEEF